MTSGKRRSRRRSAAGSATGRVQMMSGHTDPKTVMRYDHHRENLDQNAVNLLSYG
jgi:integrase